MALFNIHTGERLKTTYRIEGRYIPEALADINRIMRDHRTGQIKPIDTGVLDLLSTLEARLDTGRAFHIISGYRSPATNEFLRSTTSGVAKKSLHLKGKAVDVRVPGLDISALERAAVKLNAGGVGYYPDSDFVHLDVGRVRCWKGKG